MLEKIKLTNWSNTRKSSCYISHCHNIEEINKLIDYAVSRKLTICPRGSGYSYYDQTFNDENIILDTSNFNKIISFDKGKGIIEVEPGIKLYKLIDYILAHGWIINSIPGIADITVGGAVGFNVHGKDVWKKGSFCNQIEKITIINSQKKIINLEKNQDSFSDFIGITGFFGIIVKVKIKLEKINSTSLMVKKTICNNYKDLVSKLEMSKSDFLVGWVDAFAKNKSLGRGFVLEASFVDKINLRYKYKKKYNYISSNFQSKFGEFLWKTLSFIFRRRFIILLNFFIFYHSKFIGKKNYIEYIFDYLFIHKTIPNFKYFFGKNGFFEIQILIPKNDLCLKNILLICQKYKFESFMLGIKKHSKDNFRHSFQMDGFSIGIDFPNYSDEKKIKSKELFIDELFNYLKKIDSKIYFAKDSIINKSTQILSSHDIDAIVKLKNKFDPLNLFSSNFYRRLIN